MRRLAAILSFVALVSIAPAPVAAATQTCTVNVTPTQGIGTTTYRIKGRHFYQTTDGTSLEVQIVIWKHTRQDPKHVIRVMWLSLIPGGTRWYVDFNQASDGEPALNPGRYNVDVETPHQRGCHTHAAFRVTS